MGGFFLFMTQLGGGAGGPSATVGVYPKFSAKKGGRKNAEIRIRK